MKSLEHIIREIREGKYEKSGKKTLEGSIRKVMKAEKESSFAAKDSKPVEEDVGGLVGSGTGGEPKLHTEDGKKKKTDEAVGIIGTDDYKGNQPFRATPHIKPPAGPGSHSQAPENVSRQRTFAKERGSMTIHGKVSEGVATKLADPIIKGLEDLLKVAPEAKLPAVVTPKGAPVKPKAGVPSKVEPKVEPKTEVPSKVDTKTEPKTEIPSKVDTKTEPKTGVPSKVDTKTEPKTEVPTVKTPKEAPAPKTEVPSASGTKGKTEIPPAVSKMGKVIATLGLPGLSRGVSSDIAYDTLHKVPHKVSVGHAKKHKVHAESVEERKDIENMPRGGDRKSIQYVGRKDSDVKSSKQKTSRLATIKNVLDEAKKNLEIKQIKTEDGKTKVFDYGKDVLIINPNRQRINLDVDSGNVPNDYK